MSLARRISQRWGVSERHQRRFTQLLQVVLLGVTSYGLLTVQLGIALTSGIPLLVSLLPTYLRRNHGIPLDAGWMLWVTAAVSMHVFGTLGFYDRAGWYDQAAHALSGALVAACGFAIVRAVDVASDDIELTETFISVFTVTTVLAVGVGWELAEFGTEIVAEYVGGDAALVVRGVDDVVFDLAFDAVGAVVVAVWDARARTLFPVTAALAEWLRRYLE